MQMRSKTVYMCMCWCVNVTNIYKHNIIVNLHNLQTVRYACVYVHLTDLLVYCLHSLNLFTTLGWFLNFFKSTIFSEVLQIRDYSYYYQANILKNFPTHLCTTLLYEQVHPYTPYYGIILALRLLHCKSSRFPMPANKRTLFVAEIEYC